MINLSELETVDQSGFTRLNSNDYELIGFYFSAHWCPPSRLFTPRLVSFYKQINSAKKKLEIVLISFDRDSANWQSYFEEMPWVSIPFKNMNARLSLAKSFNILNPFALVIVNSACEIVSTTGIDEINTKGQEAYNFWLSLSNNTSKCEAPVCKEGHLMSLRTDIKERICEHCSNKIYWECQCLSPMCHICQCWLMLKATEDPGIKCAQSHELRKTNDFNDYNLSRALNDKICCKTCNKNIIQESYHCRQCLYDICENCVEIIQNLQYSCKKLCVNGHGLKWVHNLSIINQQKFQFCGFRCENCKESFIGGGGFACIGCDHYECTSCFNSG